MLLRHRHSSAVAAVADTMFQLQYLLASSRLLRCRHSGNVSPVVVRPFWLFVFTVVIATHGRQSFDLSRTLWPTTATCKPLITL